MFQGHKKIFWEIGLFLALFLGILLTAPALLQAQELDTGIDYAAATGLVNTDIRIIVAKIINVALGLLGIIALVLVLWGGYEYMTAGGDEEKVTKAKKIMLDAAIGLAIILSAFAITQFVISKLTDAIMAQYQEQAAGGPGEPTNCVGGQCYSNTAFYATVESQGNLPLKNIIVTVNFKEEPNLPAPVNKDTATLENIQVVPVVSGAGTADEVLASAPFSGFLQFAPNSGDSTVEFHPTGSCAPENPDVSVCFGKNTTYKVILSPNIKEAQISGLLAKNLDCANHACSFYFTTGDKYDNTPPQAAMVLPGNSANLPTDVKTTVSATASDDVGLQGAVFHSSKEQVPFGNLAFTAPYPLSVNDNQLKYENFTPQLTDKTKKETWQLSVEVKDLAGHSAVAQQSVNVLPGFCFNKEKDADETDIDCGPNCGACANADCNTNADCASGYCDLPAKKCAVKTKITNVDPKDGAMGNYVSIFGENFGAFEFGKSKVIFLGNVDNATDNKVAQTAQCFGKYSWQDDFIVVAVPNGAANGPIKVVSASSTGPADTAHEDSTNDDFGPVFPVTQVFVINSVTKPGLCGLNPDKQSPKMPVIISGSNFGASKGASQIKFGDFAATFFSKWSNQDIATQVPASLPTQKLTVKAIVNNQTSNSLPFEVLLATAAPNINYITPEAGSKGSYVTIYGNNFGKAVGKVKFTKNKIEYNTEPLPNECGSGWSDTQIVAKVPLDVALTDGQATVRVYDNSAAASNIKPFIIDSKKAQANLCKIEPDNGPIGQLVKLYGDSLAVSNNGWGNVVFTKDKKVKSDIWSEKTNNKIGVAVPAGTESGPVKVELFAPNFSLASNQLNFKVQNCAEEINNNKKTLAEVCGEKQQCCPAGYCLDAAQSCAEGIGAKASIFAWSFSTGKLPVVPEVVVACGEDIVPSPSPALNDAKNLQPSPTNVCVNAEIKVRFTPLIQGSSVVGSVVVESCDNEACANPAPVLGDIYLNLTNQKFLQDWLEKTGDESVVGAIYDTITFKPTANSGLLDQNKWYRVTLTTDIKSEVLEAPQSSANMFAAAPGACVDPVGKKAAYCFKFKTKDSGELCKLGWAIVSPDSFTAQDFNQTYKDLYNVTAISADNKCWSINAAAYNWQWNAGAAPSSIDDPSTYAKVTNDQEAAGGVLKGKPMQHLITKDKETPADGEKVWAKTGSGNNEVKDDAELFISPKKPKLIDWWPKCDTTCPNAAIGALFDADMDLANFTKAVKLKECGQGDVFDVMECTGGKLQFLSAETSTTNPKEFIFKLAANTSLSPGFWYEVSFNNGIKSIGGSELDDSSKHPWNFKVKNDPSNCALDHVNIFPASSIVYWIGDYADYLALPFGAPDECSPLTGQMLTADKYNWSWSATDANIAKISQNDSDPANGLIDALASSTAVGKGAVNAVK
ncbi:MAG: IPT/TIG domain-containing protein, partial [Patescibacteria group bacterium]